MAYRWRADAAGPSLNARMITDFSGDPDQNCWENLHFCDISGRGGGRLDPRMSYGGESFGVRPFFYCCSYCIRGLPVVLSRRKRTSRRKNQLQTTFICQGRRTVLCPWARHIYPCFSTGSTQEDPSRYIWKIADWKVKNQIKQNRGVVRGFYHVEITKKWRIKIVDLVT